MELMEDTLAESRQRRVPGRGESKCKGFEASEGLACLRNKKKAVHLEEWGKTGSARCQITRILVFVYVCTLRSMAGSRSSELNFSTIKGYLPQNSVHMLSLGRKEGKGTLLSLGSTKLR